MTINEIQDEIIEEFELFEDWMEKYEHLISYGKSLPSLNDEFKVDDNVVKGCQSKVWLVAEEKDHQLHFKADSDAFISKGIIGLLVRIFDNQSAKEIAETDLYAIEKIGLKNHLSPNRANGLSNMVKKIKMMALAHSAAH